MLKSAIIDSVLETERKLNVHNKFRKLLEHLIYLYELVSRGWKRSKIALTLT